MHSKIIVWVFAFVNLISLACCAKNVTLEEKQARYQIVASKCREYGELRYVNETYPSFIPGDPDIVMKKIDCLQTEALINSGTPAAAKEFPHMVAIGYGADDPDTVSWGCGGSLISDRYVLSAAQCQTRGGRNGSPATWARLGVLNLYSPSKDAQPATYRISERIQHPAYKPQSKYHDLALFKLNDKVKFTTYIRPICLYPMQGDPVKFASAFITGWGKECASCVKSDVLLKAKVDLMRDDQCAKFYSKAADLAQGFSSGTMICAFDEIKGHDSCDGDSGGPLQVPIPDEPCMYYQIGVTSFGRAICGVKGIPGVYTQLTSYIPWIQSIVWPSED